MIQDYYPAYPASSILIVAVGFIDALQKIHPAPHEAYLASRNFTVPTNSLWARLRTRFFYMVFSTYSVGIYTVTAASCKFSYEPSVRQGVDAGVL